MYKRLFIRPVPDRASGMRRIMLPTDRQTACLRKDSQQHSHWEPQPEHTLQISKYPWQNSSTNFPFLHLLRAAALIKIWHRDCQGLQKRREAAAVQRPLVIPPAWGRAWHYSPRARALEQSWASSSPHPAQTGSLQPAHKNLPSALNFQSCSSERCQLR